MRISTDELFVAPPENDEESFPSDYSSGWYGSVGDSVTVECNELSPGQYQLMTTDETRERIQDIIQNRE